ncbi:hypothetical protein MKW98_023302 [Papaver atlanticum]|uniref:Endoglucanase n=1 Tax=Papaver atlanticum TaxID=357466 RepID=A0AAD4TE04_9MAGN|nr:hypothetical protein MKW98_023302 [Papaver atlanticum]
MESNAGDDDTSKNLNDFEKANLDEAQESRLLGGKKEKYVDLGRKICITILAVAFIVGLITFIIHIDPHNQSDSSHDNDGLIASIIRKVIPRKQPQPDKYTQALRKALMFFNAQRSGRLPKHNNVSWRGNSGMKDGFIGKNLVGGFYDGGDTIKFNFPQSFAMTMLSWSVIEYSGKYKAAGELNHVKEIIKWGTDYLLKTVDSSSDTIDRIYAQVGTGDPSRIDTPTDHYCWMRPEDMDYPRDVHECRRCSDLAAEMAAALASASIVFKNNKKYSKKLVHGAETLYKFARDKRGRYSADITDASIFYNSTSYWDEFLWGATWLYYATGNTSYLERATSRVLAKHAGAFSAGPNYGIPSWDNKLTGAQVLLNRLRFFLNPGYPYEDMLGTFNKQTDKIMCSYLPVFRNFKRTKGGLIQLNHGAPQPLQYVVHAAFLANLYADYLDAVGIPGWYCGPNFYTTQVMHDFARTQIDYILGKNPLKMSYVVGFGQRYPKHVHHRAASIPKNKIKYTCEGGWKWRDTNKPDPNTIIGAMVGGPDKHDGFRDVRTNYNYTEPTLAGNAGLVAALVALSSKGKAATSIDMSTMFSKVPPMFPPMAPGPAPWKP